MAKLGTLKPQLATLSTRRVATITEERDTLIEWRGWYKLARWKAKPHGLRWRTILRDQFTCQMCNRTYHDTSQLVGDHKTPHRGDPDLFWSEANVWTICAPCHNGAKQRQEQASRRHGP